eukprot:281387-Prymnesium_polylepis.2
MPHVGQRGAAQIPDRALAIVNHALALGVPKHVIRHYTLPAAAPVAEIQEQHRHIAVPEIPKRLFQLDEHALRGSLARIDGEVKHQQIGPRPLASCTLTRAPPAELVDGLEEISGASCHRLRRQSAVCA